MLSTGRILSLYPILCVPKVNPWMARGKSAPIVPPVPAPAQVAHMALASDSDLTATSTQIEIITRMTLRQFQGNKIERRKKKPQRDKLGQQQQQPVSESWMDHPGEHLSGKPNEHPQEVGT
eukprot:CAMPEP_0201601238 /NCGR_PEP_ID=MMETSP0492-20130828/2237_1 /ASSEMBLY_ACC=CAM_ASM_000837 /TAXON_ID=420259 /ORGANISM="Thalassiosira gravida, Strain GMp14c1" /LENGTH=120 /DNA_ID=CAMNT_0048064377 /DNA_START=568 /DNA_END=928 /DNA_ORIENTATION=-